MKQVILIESPDKGKMFINRDKILLIELSSRFKVTIWLTDGVHTVYSNSDTFEQAQEHMSALYKQLYY